MSDAPSWGDIGRRVVWLAYRQYRETRRAWRRWRFSRRHRVRPIRVGGNLGSPIRVRNPYSAQGFIAGPANGLMHYGLGNSGMARAQQQADLTYRQMAMEAQRVQYLAQIQGTERAILFPPRPDVS